MVSVLNLENVKAFENAWSEWMYVPRGQINVYYLLKSYLYKEKCTNHKYTAPGIFTKGIQPCNQDPVQEAEHFQTPKSPLVLFCNHCPLPQGEPLFLLLRSVLPVSIPCINGIIQYAYITMYTYVNTVYILTMCSVWLPSLNIILWDSTILLWVTIIHPKSVSVNASWIV